MPQDPKWERVPDPTKTENWERIPDPTATPPITSLEGVNFRNPPKPLKEHTWGDQAVAMGIRTVPTIAGGILGGVTAGPLGAATGAFSGGALGEGWARDYLGEESNPAAELTEGALAGITAPFGPAMPGAKEGLKALIPFMAKNAAIGGVTEAASSVPRHIVETGKWELPSLEEAGTQGLFGAGFGGLTAGAIGGAPHAIRGAGSPIATAGRFMQNYTPISDLGTRAAAGFAGHSYGGPMGAMIGTAWGRAPKVLTGLEEAAGRGLESIGNRMQNIGIDTNAQAIEDFFGRNTPQSTPVPPDVTINQASPGPMDRAPFNESDVEALRPFRETQGPPIPPPDVTVNQTTPNPLADAPFNTPDAEALAPYQNWNNGPEPIPTPITVNQNPPGPFDRIPLSETPVAPPPNVGTGSAFEKYMQAKSAAARAAGKVLPGEDAPPVDVEGNELSFNQSEAPDVAVQAGASANPDMEIQWPRTPTPDEINQMEASGFKFDSIRNIFKRFVSDESGEFRPRDLWENAKGLVANFPRRNVGTGSPFERHMQDKSAAERQNAPGQQELPFGPLPPQDTGSSMLFRGGLIDPPSPIWNNERGESTRYFSDNRDVAENFSNKRNEPLWGLNLPNTQADQYREGAMHRVPQDVARQAVKIHPESDGLDVAPLRQQNIFERFVKDESGEFRPGDMWANIRRYFGSREPASNADWLNVELRARIAGDDEAARVAREARGVSTPFRPTGEPVADPQSGQRDLIDDLIGGDWEPEDPWTTSTPSRQPVEPQQTDMGPLGVHGLYIPRPDGLQLTLDAVNRVDNLESLDAHARYWGRMLAQAGEMYDAPTSEHAQRVLEAVRNRSEYLGRPHPAVAATTRAREAVGLPTTTPEPQIPVPTSLPAQFTLSSMIQSPHTPRTEGVQLNTTNEGWDLIGYWREVELDAHRTGDNATADRAADMQSEIHDIMDRMNAGEQGPFFGPDAQNDPGFANVGRRQFDLNSINRIGTLPEAQLVRSQLEQRADTAAAQGDHHEARHLELMIQRVNEEIRNLTPQPVPQPIATADKNLWQDWHSKLPRGYLQNPPANEMRLPPGPEPTQELLGSREQERLDAISNASISDLDPNFPTSPFDSLPDVTIPDDGTKQPKIVYKKSRLAESIKVPRADIVAAIQSAETKSSHLGGDATTAELRDMSPADRRTAIDRDSWHRWAKDQLDGEPNGTPGLTVSGGSAPKAVYRDSQGRPIAMGSGYNYSGGGGIGTLAADKTSGLYGKGTFAVLNALYDKGLKMASGSISPHTRDLLKKILQMMDEAGIE